MHLLFLSLGLGLIGYGIFLGHRARASWESRSVQAQGVVTSYRSARRGYQVDVKLEDSELEARLAKPVSFQPNLGMKIPLRRSCADSNFVLAEGASDKVFVPFALLVIGGFLFIGSTLAF
jgi:hypothetical protein